MVPSASRSYQYVIVVGIYLQLAGREFDGIHSIICCASSCQFSASWKMTQRLTFAYRWTCLKCRDAGVCNLILADRVCDVHPDLGLEDLFVRLVCQAEYAAFREVAGKMKYAAV